MEGSALGWTVSVEAQVLTLETVVKVELEGQRSEWYQGCWQAQVWRGTRLLGRAEWYVPEEH